jgi:hypothetical protein
MNRMNDLKNWIALTFCLVIAITVSACSQGHVEHYVSSEIHGEAQKINLDEVQKAFFDMKKGDGNFQSQMAAFEKRVNEIYDGQGVVALDATRENNRLSITGYLDKNDKPGYQNGDEKLFTLEQTGDVVNNEMPYRVSGYDGRPYYEGHRSILDNPFVQMMVLSHMMNSWGGRYYTPYNSYDILRTHQNTWRQTPQYTEQKASNQGFFSRFKKNSDGSLTSKKSFGSSSFSSGTGSSLGSTSRRSWGFSGGSSGFSSGSSSSSGFGSSSGWGGRRSGFSLGSRGWGGRRR